MAQIEEILANSKLDEALSRSADARRMAKISLRIGFAAIVIALIALFWR